MTNVQFFHTVRKGDIIVLRKDLEVGEDYEGFTYLKSMPEPGTRITYISKETITGFSVLESVYLLSPDMVDHIEGQKETIDDSEKVILIREKELAKEFKQVREQFENLQKNFDKIAKILEPIK